MPPSLTEHREIELARRRSTTTSALAGLVFHVAVVDVWNRLNVSTRQVAGEVKWVKVRAP
ncbi:MAG: hypothetical protein ABR567_07730 [Myxococcales bacterium]|nr:hypothetical protein [Myxococcales bacterium]